MSAVSRDFFGPGSNFEHRYIKSYEEISETVKALKKLGLKIVLTMGTYDLTHIGHLRYLEQAKQRGDVLIVGVDSDEKVHVRKGPNRPVVGEQERLEVLTHSRHVDLVFLKQKDDPQRELIRTVRPDVMIISLHDHEHSEEEIKALEEFCGKVEVLEPQATTSTSAKIRLVIITHLEQIEERLKQTGQRIYSDIDSLLKLIAELKGVKQ